MTREAIPSFDLYAELEVSRSASAAAIEAAYRRLAKLHHPDAVAGAGGGATGDDARIKRLNTARDWLTDPDRRARYDRITGPRPILTMSTARGSGESRPRARSGATAGEAGAAARRNGGLARPDAGSGVDAGGGEERDEASWASYGPNAPEVRQFLADLREIDYARALEVRGGIQAATAAGHATARSVAYEAGRSRRLSEWLFARDAAAVIVRTRLGEVGLAGEVVEPLADAAGAIAIRDLLPHPDFDLLLLPWTWRGDHMLGRPVTPRSMAAVRILPRHVRPTAAASRVGAKGAAKAGATEAGAPKRAGTARQAGTGGGIPWARIGRRVPLVATSASALALSVVFVALGSALLNGGPQVAVGDRATHVPSASLPNLAAVPTSPPATSAPVPLPTEPLTGTEIDPATLAKLRAGVSLTLATLRSAAAHGAVATAQTLLGRSAPGLRASGLRRATFPNPAPSDIAIEPADIGWTASIGTDTLASADGVHWTFDYGDRPLARFGPATPYTLYFLDPVRHDVVVTLTMVSISRTGVTLGFAWTYGPSTRYGNDGPYFAGDQLVVSALTLGGRSLPITSGVVSGLGTSALSGSILVPGTALRPASVSVDVAVIDPSAGRIDTTIDLSVR